MARNKDKMKCNSPRRITKGEAGHGRKKFVVKACSGGKEKIVMFGDANMEIKKDNPERRKNFRQDVCEILVMQGVVMKGKKKKTKKVKY